MEERQRVRKVIELEPALAERIEDYWHRERLGSWSEAARDLMRRGLEAREVGDGG